MAPIYVEIRVRGTLDEIWQKTQTPDLHERWDLRFSKIEYLPRHNEQEPQRFRYATRIGFGQWIEGGGETTGTVEQSGGQRSSALRFWSEDSRSLIKEGSGFWSYRPVEGGVDFVTGYDYQVRFGRIGRWFDRLVFRPMMGWATAWSFDRLRLWIEHRIDPASAARAALAYTITRGCVALAWVYHGFVPKLMLRDSDEIILLVSGGIDPGHAIWILNVIGWAEVFFGLVTALFWMSRWPLWMTCLLMPLALLGVAATAPSYLGNAFNPVSLNLLMAAAAAASLVLWPLTPSALRCDRRRRSHPR